MKFAILALILLGTVACNKRGGGNVQRPPQPKQDLDMDNSPVPIQNSGAPTLADFDGRNFIKESDAEQMGANMDPRVKEKVHYENVNGIHQWKLGLDELQMTIWAYTDSSGAGQRLTKEKNEDTTGCQILLKRNMASLAEVKDSGMGNGHMKRVIRTDGNGVVSYTVQKGNYIIKIGWGDSCPSVQALDDFAQRCQKALSYVLRKLP